MAGKFMQEEHRLATKKPGNSKARSEEAGLIVGGQVLMGGYRGDLDVEC